jgi:hypothetical protein
MSPGTLTMLALVRARSFTDGFTGSVIVIPSTLKT